MNDDNLLINFWEREKKKINNKEILHGKKSYIKNWKRKKEREREKKKSYQQIKLEISWLSFFEN